MEMKRKKKRIIIPIACIIVLWITVGLMDHFRVSRFERPLFCLLRTENGCDDGGSGTYRGLGYSFDITGNFMPEDEHPGVSGYTCYVFGNEVSSGIRD